MKASEHAVDLSPEMPSVARGKNLPENVAFLLADIHQARLPDNSFDRVICNAAFPHFEDRRKALGEMIRMLRPGGTLVVSHPIGREAVNKLHREVSPVVAKDRLPTAEDMRELPEQAGLADICVSDEPNFYLASGRKSLTE